MHYTNKSATIYTDVSRKEVFLVAKKVGNRQYKTLKCTVCNEENYRDERNVKNTDKLELNRYCPRCRKHTVHKEKK